MTLDVSQFPTNLRDHLIAAGAGPEPPFDSVAGEFLVHQHRDLEQRVARGGLLDFAVMGQNASPEGRAELREVGTRLIGSVAYFPEKYGTEIVAVAPRARRSAISPAWRSMTIAATTIT